MGMNRRPFASQSMDPIPNMNMINQSSSESESDGDIE